MALPAWEPILSDRKAPALRSRKKPRRAAGALFPPPPIRTRLLPPISPFFAGPIPRPLYSLSRLTHRPDCAGRQNNASERDRLNRQNKTTNKNKDSVRKRHFNPRSSLIFPDSFPCLKPFAPIKNLAKCKQN